MYLLWQGIDHSIYLGKWLVNTGTPEAVLGDTGAPAGPRFFAASSDPSPFLRLGLDSDSRVVIVATEGATEPEGLPRDPRQDPEEMEGRAAGG